MADSPSFPRELEREIFVTTAYHEPLAIPRLMLVAWRVKIWIAPLFCRTVVISTQPGNNCLALHGRPGYPFQKFDGDGDGDVDIVSRAAAIPASILPSIRHLCLVAVPDTLVDHILSAASNVEDLWINTMSEELWPLVSRLPLRHLHADPESFFPYGGIEFSHPFFARLTHLELTGVYDTSQSTWAGLSLLPNLTHLSYNYEYELSSLTTMLLRICTSLQALILITSPDSGEEVGHNLARDPRFVRIVCQFFVRDWQMGALRGIDYWSRADEFIARRISGEVDPLVYVMPGDASLDLP